MGLTLLNLHHVTMIYTLTGGQKQAKTKILCHVELQN